MDSNAPKVDIPKMKHGGNLSKSSRGFTLLEIAIAVTLLAMVMTLAAVQVRGYHARQQLEYAAYQLQLRLKALRQKSVREERTCAVRVDWKESHLLWSALSVDDSRKEESEQWSGYETLYNVEEPIELIKPPAGKGPAVSDDAVYFFKDGRCTPATYQLQHSRTKESQWVVLTDWSGEVAVQDQP